MKPRITWMKELVLPIAGLLAALWIAGSSHAEGGYGQRGERGGPPQVALDACAEALESEACSFEGRRGEQLSGTCELERESLVCVPEGHRRGRGGHGDERCGEPAPDEREEDLL